MYVDMYGITQMLYKEGELKYGKEGVFRFSFMQTVYSMDFTIGFTAGSAVLHFWTSPSAPSH